MTKLDFFRKLAEMWKHRNDKYDPANENYVGHAVARAMGKAKCTCEEHGTWLGSHGERVDILCPFHGR